MTATESADRWIDATLGGMTIEQKIGQMITAEIAGGYLCDADPRLARWIRLARDLGVGGFVVYGGTPRDVARLLNRLQEAARVPILMSSDFEGGPGQQVAGASEFPGDMAFSAAGSEDLVYRAASVGAAEGRAMGIRLTYSPVADVTVSADNPAESVRTFGSDVAVLGRMIRAYIRGYQEHGMLATAKHFPGRGDSRKMPGHPGFSWLDRPAADIEAREFAAFRHAIEGGVSFVMTEHIAVPSVADGSELPASVEPKLVTGWIRERLGFTGVITSDDLWYDAVVERFGAEDVAVKAVQAGHDIVLKPRDPFAAAAAARPGGEDRRDHGGAHRRLGTQDPRGQGPAGPAREPPGGRGRGECRGGLPRAPRRGSGDGGQVADPSQERPRASADGVGAVGHRQHQRPEGGRGPVALAARREAGRRVPGRPKLHPPARHERNRPRGRGAGARPVQAWPWSPCSYRATAMATPRRSARRISPPCTASFVNGAGRRS